MSNNLICPVLKGPCIREKCICFSFCYEYALIKNEEGGEENGDEENG